MGFTIETEEVVDREMDDLKERTGIRTTSELFRRALVALRREVDALQERRSGQPVWSPARAAVSGSVSVSVPETTGDEESSTGECS